MTTETKSLHEKRAAIIVQMQTILDKAKTDSNRSLSKDENTQWNKLDDEQESITKDIRRIEKLHELSLSEKERLLQAGKKEGTSADEQEGKEKKAISCLTAYCPPLPSWPPCPSLSRLWSFLLFLSRAWHFLHLLANRPFLVPHSWHFFLARKGSNNSSTISIITP